MAEVLKVLGQAAPAAAANGNLYTVPNVAGKAAVVSSLVVANTGVATTYRIFVRQAGAAAAVGNALSYDVALEANEVVGLALGITLGATDVITVQSASGLVTFHAFGSEVG